MGKNGNSGWLYFLSSRITADGDSATKLKDACSLEENLWPTQQHIKNQRHYFANKSSSSQSYDFSISPVWMWELDHKENWAPKNWCFWTVVLEKILETPLGCEEIQSVHPKGNQSWIFIEGLTLKLKLQSFGQLMRRTDSLKKTLLLGKRRRGWQQMRWLDGITD